VKNFLTQYVLPPAARRALWKIFIAPRYRPTAAEAALLDNNRVFLGKHSGERCFILGNGPSLVETDIERLRNEATFVMSGFSKHPAVKHGWQPTYFCVLDAIERHSEEEHVEKINSHLATLRPEALFYPIPFRPLFDTGKLATTVKPNWVKFSPLYLTQYPDPPSIDPTGTIPLLYNSGQLAILLALYMGFREIILLGMDHDWLAHRSDNRHFYPKNGSVDHVHLGSLPYGTMIKGSLITWEIYEHFRTVGLATGQTIINATPGGFLDVFPRVDFETLF
jgi:hypothetical protein